MLIMFLTWIDYFRKCLINSFESWCRWFRFETWSLYESERSKCNIFNMKIYNVNRNSFVISETSLHNWLTNKSKSCKDSIRDNYDDNYVNWSLRNLLSVILSTFINLNCFTRIRSTDRLIFKIDNCQSDRFMSTVDLKSILYNQIDLSWQSTWITCLSSLCQDLDSRTWLVLFWSLTITAFRF